jgi:hypothetical protein
MDTVAALPTLLMTFKTIQVLKFTGPVGAHDESAAPLVARQVGGSHPAAWTSGPGAPRICLAAFGRIAAARGLAPSPAAPPQRPSQAAADSLEPVLRPVTAAYGAVLRVMHDRDYQ